MAFAPNSSIWLCTVPFDNTYKNQVRFSSAQAQATYFATQTKKTFSDYVVVRKTLPNGGVRSSVKVEANIDDLYGYNYMFYRNANHGTRNFYCFITDLIYINDGTTEIVFETDVYQTWLFDVQLLESFVVREHSETDEIGDHIVPEPLNYGDYTYKETTPSNDGDDGDLVALTQWGYLVGTSVFVSDIDTINASRGTKHSGIYQGVYFYYFTETGKLNWFLDKVEAEKEDSILFISLLPRFSVNNSIETIFSESASVPFNGYVNSTPYPNYATLRIDAMPSTFGTYTPKNKKLFTAQFCSLLVTNHSGSEREYNFEDFDSGEFLFDMAGDVCANPSITIYPYRYKGIVNNIDEGLSITNFPQCAYHSDSFKLWLAKNQYSIRMNEVAGIGSIIAGTALLATGGGTMAGVGMIVGGATKIASTLNNQYKASREANQAHVDVPRNNLLTAITQNKFSFYFKQIKEEYAKAIDDYFTMYGYQTNRIKIPNTFSRPKFNYVQTIDVNIAPLTGGIPCDDMVRLKKVYNDGVTLWASSATVGDYSVVNSPQ